MYPRIGRFISPLPSRCWDCGYPAAPSPLTTSTSLLQTWLLPGTFPAFRTNSRLQKHQGRCTDLGRTCGHRCCLLPSPHNLYQNPHCSFSFLARTHRFLMSCAGQLYTALQYLCSAFQSLPLHLLLSFEVVLPFRVPLSSFRS